MATMHGPAAPRHKKQSATGNQLERTTGFEPATLTLATAFPVFTLCVWFGKCCPVRGSRLCGSSCGLLFVLFRRLVMTFDDIRIG